MARGRKKKNSTNSSSSSLSNNSSPRHFFKVYLPHFSSQRLKIPITFLKNFNGVVPQKIILKGSIGRFWHVELVKVGGDVFFEDGWQGFVKDHALQLGDFLVFGYEGDSLFDVKIFDCSECEKEEVLTDGEVLKIPWVIKEEEQTEAEEIFTERRLADEGECTQPKNAEDIFDIKEEDLKTTDSVKSKDAPFTTSPNQLNPDQLGLENVESESEFFSESMDVVRPLRTITLKNAKWKCSAWQDGVTVVDLTETSSSASLD